MINMKNARKIISYKGYKYCFVPCCNNSTHKTPGKRFINVPKGDIRKKWIKITRRDINQSSMLSTFYCCEDHFNLEEDIENYMRIKLDPSARVVLKKGTLPRFFECQKDRKHTIPITPRACAEKLNKHRILKEAIAKEKARKKMSVSNIKMKVEPKEERAETALLTNLTKTSIFKVKEEPKEPEGLSDVYVEDSLWLNNVKIEIPRVKTESDCNTSDYLSNENVECKTEIMPDVKVKQEFAQIEFISFPNIEFESNDYSNCNVNEENKKLELKRKTSTERVRRFREKQRQIKQQESQQKGTHGGSRRPRRSTKIPKSAADYCREYRQRIKEKRERLIQNNYQYNSTEVEEPSNINILSTLLSSTSKLESTHEDNKPRSRRPRRSTKIPKTPAQRCREYRQRVKENRERLINNNRQSNSMEVEEPWHINNLSTSSSSTSNYLSNMEDSSNMVNLSEQQESLRKGSRRPRKSTKIPKSTADYCREYRQRIKEKRECLDQYNSTEVEEPSNINILSTLLSSTSKFESAHEDNKPCSRRPRRSTKIPKTPAERCREYRQRVKENRERLIQNNSQNNSTGIEETSESNIKIKIEPEEERAEATLLTNFTIFKVKEEPKEPEELSNVHVEDSIWLNDVKVELPRVKTESSDYLSNENVEYETETTPDIKVKQEFEQIEYSEHPV